MTNKLIGVNSINQYIGNIIYSRILLILKIIILWPYVYIPFITKYLMLVCTYTNELVSDSVPLSDCMKKIIHNTI